MIIRGDCLEMLAQLPDSSVDSIVTDPPYGLSFMGNKWDYDVPGVEIWRECFRVVKPGAHLLAFFGSRTYHRGAIPIEDAGFDIRDQIMWIYGSGFPKSTNISKQIDWIAGADRPVVGIQHNAMSGWSMGGDTKFVDREITESVTPEAKEWEGWGTALKPAHEPIVVARKPVQGTVAANVLEFRTGGINIDGCRVGERFPANVTHDGIDERWADYFYCPKASNWDRNEGIRHLEAKQKPGVMGDSYMGMTSEGRKQTAPNNHPTVKPTDLMRYLCRLVTPPGGTVLDPFTGSGSTGKAAIVEGFEFIGIEREDEYANIAEARIRAVGG